MSETPAVPIEGKCNAKLKGQLAGQLCAEDPLEGRTRCRVHGGMSLRAADHPRFRHGLDAKRGGAGGIFDQPYTEAQLRLIDRWRRDPEDALRQQIAEGSVDRLIARSAGDMATAARMGTMVASSARALVSLREVPPPEKGLPKVVEMYEGRTIEDFERDLELLQREAAVPSR